MTAPRILPPGVRYAAGLVCEHRPDLADDVRSALFGADPRKALSDLALARAIAKDEQGYRVAEYLSAIYHYAGQDRRDIACLADALGLIPARVPGMRIRLPDHQSRVGDPTLGDVVTWPSGFGPCVIGLGKVPFPGVVKARQGAALLNRYLCDGWDAAWSSATLPGEIEALRRLIPIHAHTISPDAGDRAAWAARRLDALDVA